MINKNQQKKMAGEKAVEFISSNMVVGLGTGSTAEFAIRKLAELLHSKEITNIFCVPTSKQTEKLASELNIPLKDLNEVDYIDVTIDGADEVDKNMNLIKGGGGALLREKIVAEFSKKEIIIVDEAKRSEYLGEKFKLPIEVIPFARNSVEKYLTELGAKVYLRNNFITDEGNFIFDADFGLIRNPEELSEKLSKKAGIVEHGLFINLTSVLIVGKTEEILIINNNY